MKLVAEISDEDLLFKLVHQLGATFWRTLPEVPDDPADRIVEVVYFSGEKVVHYAGPVSKEHFDVLNATGWPVKEILVSQADGVVKVTQ